MTEGNASYNALQAIYTVRANKFLTALASYTYSKSIDVSSNGTSIANSTDQPTLGVHRTVSDFNATDILNVGWTIQYPDIQRGFRLFRSAVNHWKFSGIYTARTGHPFSVTVQTDWSLRDEPVEYASFLPAGYAPLDPHRHRIAKVSEWFNTASITYPATNGPSPGYGNEGYGDAPRNFLTGPAFILPSFAVQRAFPLTHNGSQTFNLRIDAINVFNEPNLGQPNASLSGSAAKNSSFGSIGATVGNNGSVGTNGRRLQISGIIRF